jgi:hypothetical protein
MELHRNAIVSSDAHLSGHSHESGETTIVDLSAVRFYTGSLRLLRESPTTPRSSK